MIHLDTSILVDLLRERRKGLAGPAHRALEAVAGEELGVSVFVACELFAGAELSSQPEEERGGVSALLAWIGVDAPPVSLPVVYASHLAALRRSGTEIATMDLLIGCAALAVGARLMTRNPRHFSRLEGLNLLTP